MDVFNELVKREPNLLARPLKELVPISFVGGAAVAAYRSLVGKLSDLPMTQEQKEKTLRDGQDAGKMLLAIEGRIGELLPSVEEMGTHEVREKTGRGERALPKGTTRKHAHVARTIASNPEAVEEVIHEAEEAEDIPTKTAVLNKIADKRIVAKKAEERQRPKPKPNIDKFLYGYIDQLVMINTGVEEVLQNWEYISPPIKQDYLRQVQRLIDVNKEYIEGELKW